MRPSTFLAVLLGLLAVASGSHGSKLSGKPPCAACQASHPRTIPRRPSGCKLCLRHSLNPSLCSRLSKYLPQLDILARTFKPTLAGSSSPTHIRRLLQGGGSTATSTAAAIAAALASGDTQAAAAAIAKVWHCCVAQRACKANFAGTGVAAQPQPPRLPANTPLTMQAAAAGDTKSIAQATAIATAAGQGQALAQVRASDTSISYVSYRHFKLAPCRSPAAPLFKLLPAATPSPAGRCASRLPGRHFHSIGEMAGRQPARQAGSMHCRAVSGLEILGRFLR